MGTRSNHLQGYQFPHDQEFLTPEKRRGGVPEGRPLAEGWHVERLAGKEGHPESRGREQRMRPRRAESQLSQSLLQADAESNLQHF